MNGIYPSAPPYVPEGSYDQQVPIQQENGQQEQANRSRLLADVVVSVALGVLAAFAIVAVAELALTAVLICAPPLAIAIFILRQMTGQDSYRYVHRSTIIVDDNPPAYPGFWRHLGGFFTNRESVDYRPRYPTTPVQVTPFYGRENPRVEGRGRPERTYSSPVFGSNSGYHGRVTFQERNPDVAGGSRSYK
jgi:hypothetical protein